MSFETCFHSHQVNCTAFPSIPLATHLHAVINHSHLTSIREFSSPVAANQAPYKTTLNHTFIVWSRGYRLKPAADSSLDRPPVPAPRKRFAVPAPPERPPVPAPQMRFAVPAPPEPAPRKHLPVPTPRKRNPFSESSQPSSSSSV